MNTAAEFADQDFAQLPKYVSEALDCNDGYRAPTQKSGLLPTEPRGEFFEDAKLTHSSGFSHNVTNSDALRCLTTIYHSSFTQNTPYSVRIGPLTSLQ